MQKDHAYHQFIFPILLNISNETRSSTTYPEYPIPKLMDFVAVISPNGFF